MRIIFFFHDINVHETMHKPHIMVAGLIKSNLSIIVTLRYS